MKSIIMLGRSDPAEAMRVAAGLSIFDLDLSVIFLSPLAATTENTEMAELLEFSDIEIKTTLSGEPHPRISIDELATALLEADEVISI